MRTSQATGWILALGATVLAGALAAFPLWLDAPARVNPSDPKSSLALPTNTPMPPATATASPTNVPPGSTATPTPTPTVTPSFSASPTPSQTPVTSYRWYDGDTPGALGADIVYSTGGTSAAATDEFVLGGGYGGSNYYTKLALTVTGYYADGTLNRAAPVDVSAFSSLDFYMRVPSSTGGCFTGGVVLMGTGIAPNDYSRPVTITAYIVGGGPVTVDAWMHVRIPLSAFYGDNHHLGVFSAGDLASVSGVRFLPYYNDFDGSGNFNGEAHFDDITFINTAAPERLVGWIFSDFETSDRSNWGTYWSAYSDRTGGAGGTEEWPSSECIVNGDPDGMTTVSALNYPVYPAGPQDSGGGPDTPCTAAHIEGMKGDDGDCVNVWSDPSCCGDGTGTIQHWSYVGMGASFDPSLAQAAIDVTGAQYLGAVPTGLRIKAKAGPSHQAGQNYILTIQQGQATCGGCEFQTRISDADLQPAGSWVSIDIPFPPVGTLGKAAGDPAIDTTFGQPSWVAGASEITWDFNLKQVGIGVEMDEMTFDIWVDDIQFY